MSAAGADDVTFAVADETVFVSYTHIDNEPFGPEQQRWVSHLHDQLTSRVAQLFGDRVVVWRDDKLRGNDVFPETLMEQLAKVDILVSVISPRYVNSEWCQRELDEFLRAAGENVSVGSKSRVFKVLKTPVPLDALPDGLDELLGYEFFEETEHERIREFLLNPDPEQRWKFYARVDDLAQDIAVLLREIDKSDPPEAAATGQVVYLAETTSDVTAHRDDLRRELERHGHQVLPHRRLPVVIDELPGVVRDAVAEADVSIHLLGNRYGVRPEGDLRSLPHIQIELAAEARDSDGFQQLIWISDDVQPANVEQAELLDELQRAEVGPGVEVIRAPLETFKAHVLERLSPQPPPAVTMPPADGQRIYVLHEPNDREAVASVEAELAALGHIVMVPLSEGSEAEVREIHEMSMVMCDAVLIHYGDATEHWLRMKLFDILKAPGWGRTTPFTATAVLVAPPASPTKSKVTTSEAIVLDATGGFERSVLDPFLTELAAARPGS